MTEAAETGGRGTRILVTLFFWRSLDLEGGAGLVASVVRALAKAGHSVVLLLPGRPSWLSPEVECVSFLGRTALGTCLRYLRLLRRHGAEVDAVLLLENNPMSHLLMSPWLPAARPTWVHISSPLVGAEVLGLGLRRQYLAHWLGKSKGLARILAALVGFRFPHYVVSTEFQRAELRRLGCPAARTEALPFGVDPALFPPREPALRPPGELVVGYLGHFSPIKGVEDLIEAFERAARGRPGLKLRLAWSGKGGEARRVLARIETSPLRGRIDLLGRVDVAEFLSDLDVVCLPFRSGSIPHPPLVLLEAFALGIPVVTTRVGGLAELVEEGRFGRTVPPGDREALAAALTELSDEPDLRRRMRRAILADCPGRFDTGRLCRAFESRQAPAPMSGRGAT